jgi:crotonobetainyl-CoA:carnitine CoA-transferase CaiB-like acyl-CoA transferase
VGTWIAAPVAATILADYGADVIKIEQPGAGDPYRRYANSSHLPQAPENYCWLVDARNKRSLTLNLTDPEAHAVLLRLVRECDVYITNQPLSVRRRFGLTYAELAPLNGGMIYASLTAYGESGPDAEREGFDSVAWWTRSGMADLVRAPGAPPAASVPGMGDHPSGVALYAAIATALLRRERTGRGGMVHSSLLANGLWSNASLAQAMWIDGVDVAPIRDSPPVVHRELYQAADGRFLQLYMIRTYDQFDALLIAAEAWDVLADPRFNSLEARTQHGPEFIASLRSVFAKRPAADWMETLRAAGIPVTLVAEVTDLPNDMQLVAAGIVAPPADPSVPARMVINPPINIDGMVRTGALPAPAVGQHTNEILAELGYGADAIATMRGRGAI